MPLSAIEISGFRGFRERGKLDFAIPNGEVGSGLTVITGPNNAGKSSILECLKARSGYQTPSFPVGSRNIYNEEVEIKYNINDKIETIRSIKKGSSETVRENIDQTFHVFVLPSRRSFNPYFGRTNALSREQHLLDSQYRVQRSSIMPNFERRLFTILQNQDNQERFNQILYEVITSKPEWSIDQSDQGQYFLKFFNGTISHSSDGMGEGVVSIFSIVDSLYDSKPGDAIVIDEPELSLHPALQKRVANLLCKFAKDRQIVVSTHSPYFVDLNALANGGHLARVTTGPTGTVINEISATSKELIKKLTNKNLYNPHVFGLDARELFFQEDQIILTEGQEDVLLFPRIAEQLEVSIDGNFFGWGAGGASNIRHLCSILNDLGYRKVVGLLDGDKVSEKDGLTRDFPDFSFYCIPAKDIRTKEARKATEEVEGLLNEKREIREKYIEKMQEIFATLSQYMNS